MRVEVTQELVTKHFHYCPDSGVLIWKLPLSRAVKPGQIAGKTQSNGYRQVNFLGGWYLAHRLIWLYCHGHWPKEYLDHINMDKTDNRLVNLREASAAENNWNRDYTGPRGKGLLGVSKSGRPNKPWRSQIGMRGKKICLGNFETQEQAHQAYTTYVEQNRGEFGRIDGVSHE